MDFPALTESCAWLRRRCQPVGGLVFRLSGDDTSRGGRRVLDGWQTCATRCARATKPCPPPCQTEGESCGQSKLKRVKISRDRAGVSWIFSIRAGGKSASLAGVSLAGTSVAVASVAGKRADSQPAVQSCGRIGKQSQSSSVERCVAWQI